MKKYTLLFIIILTAFAACKKAEKAKEKPEIAFAGLSHNTVVNGDTKDTLLINLRYTIAAAAVGTLGDSAYTQVHIIDKRDCVVGNQPPILFPDEVEQNLPEGEANVSGNITLRLPAANFFVLCPDRPNGDTVTYEIYLKGKNGVESNKITVPEIYIVP
ncbi:MAG TPA: hypothetical protein VIN07_07780 [Flavipsychrobacter sp.]